MTLQKNKLLNWFLVFALSLTALDCFSHSRSESYSKFNVLNNGNFYQVNLSANISNTILNNFLRLNVFKSADDVRNYASSSFKLGDNCEQDNNFKFTSNILFKIWAIVDIFRTELDKQYSHMSFRLNWKNAFLKVLTDYLKENLSRITKTFTSVTGVQVNIKTARTF